MLENRHHNIILDFNGHCAGDERWKVHPLSSESKSEFNYQRIGRYVNSCNGLLFFTDENDGEYYICSPTTNQSKVIPLPPIVKFPPPGVSPFWGCSALGFDSRSNDYKFIIAVDHYSDDDGDGDGGIESYVELYSLKTDSWKSLTDFPNISFSDHCVYADGSIYWLSIVNPYRYSIDSFDFGDETFSSFDMSPFLQPDSYHVRLADDYCGGSQLGLVACKKTNSPCCFEVWVKAAGGGWSIKKRWDFSLPQILDLDHRYPIFGIIILGFSGGILYVAAADGEVFAYDCAANQLLKFQISIRKPTSIDPVFISYVETTVSPTLSLG